LIALTGVGGVSAGIALAQGAPSLTLRTTSSGALSRAVVINAHGRTLYTLTPETTHHLLCRTRACFALWPPLTVRSRAVRLIAGHGLHGRLALLRRSDGTLQVTHRGLPLYRYAGDSGPAEVNGEGIVSFGGTWHAASASSSSPSTGATPPSTSPTTTTPTMSPSYPYGY
jgi:predicted lipoprotein with Yx(FWY)xxD motif